MTRYKAILVCVMMAASAWPALGASARFSISNSEIAAAVFKLGVSIEPGEVTILSDVMANRAAPALDVRRVERFGNNDFMVRMECVSSEDCLPFFVKIRGEQDGTAQLAKLASEFSPLNDSAASPQTRHIVIRSGTTAVLMLDGEHVHIRIPVQCLENGTPGQTIRATDKEHHRVFIAQVVDAGLLQGSLR